MGREIGFIGLGAMGKPMAVNLVKKNYSVTVFDLRPEPIGEMAKLGAKTASSSKEVAGRCDVVITMLVSSPHVEAAVLGKDGVIEGIRPGSVLIDMSTIAPGMTKKVGGELAKKGVEMLDAPVARGVKAATEGTLAIFVGGKKEVFEKNQDILGAMGTDVSYVGGLGCGEVVKLVNQLILSVNVATIAEGLVLGVKGGVEPDVLVEVLGKGSSNSFALQNHFKNFVMKGNFGENIFPTDYILKDLGLILETGKEQKVPLMLSALANQLYEFTRASGWSKNYFPVVVRLLEKVTGVEVRGKK
jgi:3-hydroxyisobutyrate dehydrogenase